MDAIGLDTDDLRQGLSSIPQNISQKQKQMEKVKILRTIQQRYNNYLLSQGVDSDQLEHDYLSQLDEYGDIIDTLKNKDQLKKMTPEFLKITLDEIKEKLEKPFFTLKKRERPEGHVERRGRTRDIAEEGGAR
jgi:hypothetical protein